MSPRKKGVSTEEVMALQEAARERIRTDPDARRAQEDFERNRERHAAAYDRASSPIVADLRRADVPISRLGELTVKGAPNYRHAIPLITDWLARVDNAAVKETLAASLTVSAARPVAAKTLINEFRKAAPDEDLLRWQLGNALSFAADESVFDELVSLLRDRSYGRDREMLAIALGRTGVAEAVDVLISLLEDDEIAGHVVIGLGETRDERARAPLERFLEHPMPWIRREAKRALTKIDRGVTARRRR